MDVNSLYTDDRICKLLYGYTYNALNRIESAWNQRGEKAAYEYNGLGQRTAKQTGEKREDYLLDLTRPYHNLLGMVKGDEAGKQHQNFYWDGNVAAMSEMTEADGTKERTLPVLHYYLQDELGSPVRVSGYGTTPHPETGTNTPYLTYGYDEFGNDLHDDLCNELEESGIPNPYSRQGKEQPFGYTGYRYDDISETYFAQAREYQPESGRFTAEDVIKGNGAVLETLNRHGYCLGNPVMLVDVDGKLPYFPTMTGPILPPKVEQTTTQIPAVQAVDGTAYVYYIDDFEREANWQIQQLEKQGLDVIPYSLSDADSDSNYDDGKQREQKFMAQWNEMDDSEPIEFVYIFCHGSERMLQFEDGSAHNAVTIDGMNAAQTEEVAGNLNNLNKKILIIYIFRHVIQEP